MSHGEGSRVVADAVRETPQLDNVCVLASHVKPFFLPNSDIQCPHIEE